MPQLSDQFNCSRNDLERKIITFCRQNVWDGICFAVFFLVNETVENFYQ